MGILRLKMGFLRLTMGILRLKLSIFETQNEYSETQWVFWDSMGILRLKMGFLRLNPETPMHGSETQTYQFWVSEIPSFSVKQYWFWVSEYPFWISKIPCLSLRNTHFESQNTPFTLKYNIKEVFLTKNLWPPGPKKFHIQVQHLWS